MRSLTSRLPLWAMALVLLTGALWARPAQAQTLSPAVSARLQFVLDSVIANNTNPVIISSLSAAIIYEGRGSWKGASGWAETAGGNKVAATTDHKYRIYSSTKSMTAALILDLMTRGELTLSDRIRDHISLANKNLDSNVTIRQLLTHRSGFSDYTEDQAFQFAIISNLTRIWEPMEVINYSRGTFPPDSTYEYSSTNYIILGLIAEKIIAPKTIEAEFRDLFFTPLGLSNMYFPPAETVPAPYAHPHHNLGPFVLWPDTLQDLIGVTPTPPLESIASAAWATGGVVSTAEDLAKWSRALYGRQGAISAAAMDSMYASLPPSQANNDDYPGYGIYYEKATCPNCFAHGGASIGYRSITVYDTLNKIAIAVLINQGTGNLSMVANKLHNALMSGIASVDNAQPVQSLTLYPNPTADFATVALVTDRAASVRVQVYNLVGQQVSSLDAQTLPAGYHKLNVNVTDLPTGVYTVRIEADGQVASRLLQVNR